MDTNTNSFVDSLIAEANPPAGAEAPGKQPLPPSAPKPAKAAPATEQPQGESADEGADKFAGMTAEQRETAEQEEIDNSSPEQRKTWDKKFVNALSRRDKDKNRLKSEVDTLKTQLAALQKAPPAAAPGAQPAAAGAAAPQALDVGKKPDVNDPKYAQNYGAYLEDLAEHRARTIANEILANHISTQKKEADTAKTETQRQAQIQVTEQKIMQEAADYIAKNPEALNVVQANADILDSYPAHIVGVIAGMDNALVAINEMAKIEGALERLGKMSPANAAIALGMAYASATADTASQTDGEGDGAGAEAQPQAQPQQQPQKPVSSAPAPMKQTPSSPGGKKQLHQMDADEILDNLGIKS